LKESLRDVNELQIEADKAVEELVVGKSKNVHETMIALNKADIAFRMTLQIRNKMVEAYQEIIRMQV
jgi:flagellar hook-basal body complex protein FliE